MKAADIARKFLKRHEGLRLKAYQCTAGKTTIGYGRNLDDRGISIKEAEAMLQSDIAECISDLESFPYWNNLNEYRQACLIDMRFCLGGQGFRAFKQMHAAIQSNEFTRAADEMLNSRFAKQVGRRALNLADVMRRGIDKDRPL